MYIDHHQPKSSLKYPEMDRLMLSQDVCCNPKCICSSYSMVSFSYFIHFAGLSVAEKKLIYFTSHPQLHDEQEEKMRDSKKPFYDSYVCFSSVRGLLVLVYCSKHA